MKRIIQRASFSVAILLGGCSTAAITGNAADVTVRVEGDRGIEFSGSIGSVGGQHTIEGITPDSFTIDGSGSSGIFVAVIQKKQTEGTMKVSLNCRKGAKSGETTADYGVVSVTCSR